MKRLVIAPHVDDDVIGCGGILGPGTVIYYCGVDPFHEVPAQERVLEAMRMAMFAGVTDLRFGADVKPVTNGVVNVTVFGEWEHEVNDMEVRGLIVDLEALIADVQPDEVLAPWPSYNQDHRAVYEALMVATRPHDRNWFVPRMLLYEEPDCWYPMLAQPFVPNLYRSIDIERKLKLYSCMPSQVRGMRSPEHLRALATVRGAACGVPAAEAYHIVRWFE